MVRGTWWRLQSEDLSQYRLRLLNCPVFGHHTTSRRAGDLAKAKKQPQSRSLSFSQHLVVKGSTSDTVSSGFDLVFLRLE
jgi:hypothetical protein